MKTLTNILRKETESLRVQFIEATKNWAAEEFETLRKWASDYRAGKFGNGEAEKKYWKLPYEIVNHNGKVQDYIAKSVKLAEKHYENSIIKLAARIEKKGLNEKKLKVETSHIGVNIETMLTDGEKTVRAFTIVAAGQVQKPHYRYLIK